MNQPNKSALAVWISFKYFSFLVFEHQSQNQTKKIDGKTNIIF